MKKLFLTLNACIITFTCFNLNSFSQNEGVKSTFIGSQGYLLESSNKKVAMDAIIYWEGDNWGYIKPPEEVKTQIENGDAPFNNLDLILISHAHTDHFNPGLIEKAMNHNSEAILVATSEVYDRIVAQAEDITSFESRIWVPNLNFFHSIDTMINGIPITVTNTEHGEEKMQYYFYSFVLDDMRFVQLNGWNRLSSLAYDTLGFNKEQADVAFLAYDFIMNDVKFKIFKDYLTPQFSTIGHIDGASQSVFNNIQDKINAYKDEYPMNLLYTPLDQLFFSKVNGELTVDTLVLRGTPLDITNVSVDYAVKVFPNPTKDILNISLNSSTIELINFEVIDIQGKTVLRNSFMNDQRIDLSNLAKGMYFIKLNVDGNTLVQRISLE